MRTSYRTKGLHMPKLVQGLMVASMMAAPAIVATNMTAIAQEANQFADAIASLAAQIRAEIARLPRDGSIENYEAAILFLADQSGQPSNVVCAAFEEVKLDPSTPDNAKQAMNIVCRTLNTRRGTGAIGSGGNNFASPSFSAPIVSIGGGSGYSQPQ